VPLRWRYYVNDAVKGRTAGPPARACVSDSPPLTALDASVCVPPHVHLFRRALAVRVEAELAQVRDELPSWWPSRAVPLIRGVANARWKRPQNLGQLVDFLFMKRRTWLFAFVSEEDAQHDALIYRACLGNHAKVTTQHLGTLVQLHVEKHHYEFMRQSQRLNHFEDFLLEHTAVERYLREAGISTDTWQEDADREYSYHQSAGHKRRARTQSRSALYSTFDGLDLAKRSKHRHARVTYPLGRKF
jgi:hypothetical protein